MAQKEKTFDSLFLDNLVDTTIQAYERGNMYAYYDNNSCYRLIRFVEANKMEPLGDPWYTNVYGALFKGYRDYCKMRDDEQTAHGAIFFRLMDKIYPKANDEGKTPVVKYKNDWKVKSGVVYILGNMKLNLKAKVKLEGLDRLNFRYKTEEYRNLYNQLGFFVLGKNPKEFDEERDEAVKIYNKLFRSIYKPKKDKKTGEIKMEITSCADDKIVSARFFLESIARNAPLLEGYQFVDKKGKLGKKNEVYEIDKESIKLMNRLVQRHKDIFSDDCLAYFAGKSANTDKQNGMDVHLNILYNKLEHTQKVEDKRVAFQDFYPRINFQAMSEKNPTDKSILRYAGFLFDHAVYNYTDETIVTSVLENMIAKEAKQHNQDIIDGCLFHDEELIPREDMYSVNKKLVLGVAQTYANSFVTSHPEGEEFNPDFHGKMTEMFGRIVTNNDYSKKEVEELCKVLRSNNDEANPDEAMIVMSREIMKAYTTPKDRGGKNGKGGR